MRALLALSFILSVFFGGLPAQAKTADLAAATDRSVDCSLNYVDFISSNHRLNYSHYSPHVILKPKELIKTSIHPFVKTTYSPRCPRCGPTHTLGPIVNPSSTFNAWVASTTDVANLNVRIELERVLNTQPYEILSLKASIQDESGFNVTTVSALSAERGEASLSLQTLVNKTPGIVNINCRIIEP